MPAPDLKSTGAERRPIASGDTQVGWTIEDPPTPVPPPPPGLFHVLAKPTGARCNLDCSYCFYLDKAALTPGSRFRMGPEVLDAYLRQLAAAFQDAPVVPLAWQGGEPTLMGLEFFVQATARLRALIRPGQRIEQTLQTNGVLLDEAWCAWLAGEQVLVGLSIDGPAHVHDVWRRDTRGRGTFADVHRAALALHRAGVAVNAMVSVHRANQDHGRKTYRYLRDELGFRHFQFLPIVEWEGGPGLAGHRREQAPVSERTVDPEAWGAFLCAVFDEWVGGDVGRCFVGHLEAALASWLGLEPAACVFRETCGDAVVLEHTGEVYSCDHFVDPSHRLGSVATSTLAAMVHSAPQRAFGAAKRDALPARCRRCPVLFACRGECPKHRLLRTEDGEAGLSWLCAGYERFYAHITPAMEILADLVRSGRDPAAVTSLLAASRSSPGRHSPCPCGSGRKYGKCHGAR